MAVNLPAPVKGVSPSARLVYVVLDDAGPLTRREIRDRTGVARRTASAALSTLRDKGLVTADEHPDDARLLLYRTEAEDMPATTRSVQGVQR